MYEIERRDDASIVYVAEDLDIAAKPRLRAAIESAERHGTPRVVLSLEACQYCDSSGLAELVLAQRRLGLRFYVVVPPDARCHRIFDLTGLTAILQISPSVETALATTLPIDGGAR